MIDATATIISVTDIDQGAAEGYAEVSRDPRSVPGFAYIQLNPERMQVWKGPAEFAGRTVMRAGVWLDDPIDLSLCTDHPAPVIDRLAERPSRRLRRGRGGGPCRG